MKAIFAAFARNKVFANIILALIFIGGYMGATQMVRELFPEFSLDIITITVPWPGADPEEVEEGICRKIEEAIDGVEGIKQYNSVSAENRGSVVIEVLEGFDVAEVKDRIRNKVDSIIDRFPLDAEEPIVEELTIRREVCFVALSGPDFTERKLKEWAEQVKDDLNAMPGISQVQIFGARDYEIAIEVDEKTLQQYGLSLGQVADIVRASNLNLSGGTVRTEGEEIRLRTMGRKYTGAELAEIVVLSTPAGETITLDRIAKIRDEFTEDPIVSRFDGNPAISVAVLKTSEEDAIAISDMVHKYVDEQNALLPPGAEMAVWTDTSDFIRARINLLLKNGVMGLVLVFACLWLFLDLRLSFWVGMGMPISVFGALAIMWLLGATLNMISLFGLIMVLGIIVDDAIVVGEAIYVHRKRGEPALRAAVEGVSEVGMPVIAAVATTVVAFLPLMFVGGVMGKFIAILPVVVIACLAISLVECLITLPAHLSDLPDPNRDRGRGHPLARIGNRFHGWTTGGLEYFVEHIYGPTIKLLLEWRYITLASAVGILMLTIGLVQAGAVKFVVFPKIDGDTLTATLEFPDGTPLNVTQAGIEQIEAAFRRIEAKSTTASGAPLIKHIFSLTGSTITEDAQPKRGNNVGSVRVEMIPTVQRGIHSDDLSAMWSEEIGLIPGAVALSILGQSAGPPGAPIEIWVQGDNLNYLTAAAEDLVEKLSGYDGVYQVQSDFRPGKNEMRFRLKPEARTLGLTDADLARQVYAGYFGEEALRVQRGREDIRIRVRYPEADRRVISELENVRIRTPLGAEVPLLSVADVEYAPGYSTINRTDGLRRVAVTAEVSGKTNANEIFADLEGTYAQIRQQYPGIQVALQGEQKKARESIGSLAYGFPLALVGIFIIIGTIFRSYAQTIIIMITIPFGVVGAVAGHLLLGYDLSMMSVFGLVAMSGVVVNDAIVLIEAFNDNIARGMPFREAVREAGMRRFRAVFLTTITTVGGLGPMLAERDTQAQFLIPMALSIAAGVAFATLLTLIFIPCCLVMFNDLKRGFAYLRTGTMPEPEMVEPARDRYEDYMTHDPASLAGEPESAPQSA